MNQTIDWLSGKFFNAVHSNSLIYNTCWEDPALDRQALQLTSADNLMVITSAGCNVLDYALEAPNRIFAVDVNPKQNALLELKMSAIRNLEFADFFELFGRGRVDDFQTLYTRQLRSSLSIMAQNYWDRNPHYFSQTKFRSSFYFRGGSGTVARLLNYYVNFKGARHALAALCQARTLEEQQKIYFGELQDLLWNRWIKSAFSFDTSLSLIGVPRPQRQQVEDGFAGGIAKFIQDRIEFVLTQLPFHQNYFWNLYLWGEYTKTCCPEYLKEENFNKLKGGLLDSIEIYNGSIHGFLKQTPHKISRYVLLDHMDWLSTYDLPVLEAEWQEILNRADTATRVIWRSGGLKTDFVSQIQVEHQGTRRPLGTVLNHHTDWAARLHKQDRVHTYGSFYIADVDASA
jgi:S-adenosylmethionine-diacylglycerol 3-amino-3-carboxypropyl transferase